MNFTRNDMYILIGSFMVVVFMTLVFPAIGLSSGGAQEGEIPNLNLTEAGFQLVGERPEYPRTPTSGELRFVDSGKYTDTVELKSTDSYTVLAETFCYDNDRDDCRVQVAIYDGGYTNVEYKQLSKSDFEDKSVKVVENLDNNSEKWEVRFEMVEQENWNSSNVDYTVKWKLESKPGDGGWIQDVPILGGVYSSANELASILGWATMVFFWFCGWIVELALGAIDIILSTVLFGFNLISFMVSSYNNMLSDVSGFASFILVTPALLLTVELAKLGYIFVNLLPTT